MHRKDARGHGALKYEHRALSAGARLGLARFGGGWAQVHAAVPSVFVRHQAARAHEVMKNGVAVLGPVKSEAERRAASARLEEPVAELRAVV